MCLPLPQTPVPGTLVSARPPTWLVLPAQAPGSVQEPQDRPLSREPGLVQVAGRPCPTSPAGSAHFPPPGSDLWEFLRFSCRSSHFLKTISSGPAPRPPPSPSQFGGGALMQRKHRGAPAGHSSRAGLVVPTSPSASWAVTQPRDLSRLSPLLRRFVGRSRWRHP